jgi:hypothetical protein
VISLNPFTITLILIWIALAVAPALRRKSLIRFFVALLMSFAVVVLPLFVFFISGFLKPDWKGGCAHGWLDCFFVGKFVLTPLVLWATAGLYSVVVLDVEKRTQAWIVLGIFIGAVVSSVCLAHGLVYFVRPKDTFALWMLVPLYVSVWYWVRAVQLIRESKLGLKVCLVDAMIGSLPFWIASVWCSKQTYAAMPDKAPNCFVVTAAGRGHGRLVGPFFEVEHGGGRVRANRQLITLWQFENLWQSKWPQSHRSFRRFYNRFGPIVAEQIKLPWLADMAYIAIKPVELVARSVTSTPGKKETKGK